MKFENLKQMSDAQFRRIAGVKRKTFEKMVEVAEASKKTGGRQLKLPVPELVLMMLEYLREYRTYAHIGASYGLSESSAFQNIRWIENVLVKSKEFSHFLVSW